MTRHPSLDLAFLSFRLDFNSFYETLGDSKERPPPAFGGGAGTPSDGPTPRGKSPAGGAGSSRLSRPPAEPAAVPRHGRVAATPAAPAAYGAPQPFVPPSGGAPAPRR